MIDQFIKRYPLGQDSGILDYPGQGSGSSGVGCVQNADPGNSGQLIVPVGAQDSKHQSDITTARTLLDGTNQSGYGNGFGAIPFWLTFYFGKVVELSEIWMYRSIIQTGGWTSDGYSPRNMRVYGTNDLSVLVYSEDHDPNVWTLISDQQNIIVNMDHGTAPIVGGIPDNLFKKFQIIPTTGYAVYRVEVYATNASQWFNLTEMKFLQK